VNRSEKEALIKAAATEAASVKRKLVDSFSDQVIEAADMIVRTLRRAGTVYLAGNGGSAADCQHFATELVVRLSAKFDRPSLPAVALTADSALLTAAANDYGFNRIFARQVEGLLSKHDILCLISTSGNSQNLIEAAETAREMEVPVLGLLGMDGGKMKSFCAHAVVVPSDSVQRIQEEHGFIIHTIVELVEADLFA
jgi:D-sedoheptulose 7-phosphate isomerase